MANPSRRSTAVLAALALAACGRRAGLAAPAPRAAPERAVYGAVFAHVFRGTPPDTVVMAESTVVFYAPALDGAVPEWRRQYAVVPAALPHALAALSGRPVPTAALPLPRPAVVLGAAAMRAMFQGGTDAGWAAFHRRFPRARVRLSVSPVAFSVDGAEAVVYYEYDCGGLCGGGDLAWLARSATGWAVRKIVPFWIS